MFGSIFEVIEEVALNLNKGIIKSIVPVKILLKKDITLCDSKSFADCYTEGTSFYHYVRTEGAYYVIYAYRESHTDTFIKKWNTYIDTVL